MAESESLPQPQGAPARRQLRNYLLDARFQMKYVSMVVGVTVVVAAILGSIAYQYSRGQTQMLSIERMEKHSDLDEETMKFIQAEAEKADRVVLLGILAGILLLAVALGLTGIVVTHKLVGPAYKIKRLLGEVRDGHMRVGGRLRKGDELRDVFQAFEEMVLSLRAAQREEVEQLDAAIAHAKEAGVPDEAIREVAAVRDRMREALD